MADKAKETHFKEASLMFGIFRKRDWLYVFVIILALEGLMFHGQYHERQRQRQQQLAQQYLEQLASQAEQSVYLGQAKEFGDLGVGHYTVTHIENSRLSIIKQNLPTGDIWLLVRGAPADFEPNRRFSKHRA